MKPEAPERLARAAQELAAAWRDMLDLLDSAGKQSKMHRRHLDRRPSVLTQKQLDRELVMLLASGGIVTPFTTNAAHAARGFTNGAITPVVLDRRGRPQADNADRFRGRWRERLSVDPTRMK